MKGDGDEKDDEARAGRDRESHADENGVEEDARFEEETLEEQFALFLEGGGGLGIGVSGCNGVGRVA